MLKQHESAPTAPITPSKGMLKDILDYLPSSATSILLARTFLLACLGAITFTAPVHAQINDSEAPASEISKPKKTKTLTDLEPKPVGNHFPFTLAAIPLNDENIKLDVATDNIGILKLTINDQDLPILYLDFSNDTAQAYPLFSDPAFDSLPATLCTAMNEEYAELITQTIQPVMQEAVPAQHKRGQISRDYMSKVKDGSIPPSSLTWQAEQLQMPTFPQINIKQLAKQITNLIDAAQQTTQRFNEVQQTTQSQTPGTSSSTSFDIPLADGQKIKFRIKSNKDGTTTITAQYEDGTAVIFADGKTQVTTNNPGEEVGKIVQALNSAPTSK
ncbi:MAG: hypothetical protein UR28_C0002G0011 [Candidatus Peregrinibacteria bacterium GW2011_GWF2_33_10]|nr:MAG: hypothetical protein UR28_C0002G0011 [Candidatus Peregrinibacteria bacterium GW2011_GWF2_33_10]OGJ45595.1 MAG: hypothetical protein A2263_00640 [Candidatus Peregrinibacteria bacterium RIFOXYA2_FULL_33_21]OGJ45973.1 MAG: hypothetical protein A2272_04495 [Candidatus Peregrinibacteria bacterium RIFOXYA12_FULL_33_12]OGJ51076.1 MAG: hypothetical protein A2307_06370 [Candidatus Peregrinibacteria bacterium RIFOXYB2_FULL_33_20]